MKSLLLIAAIIVSHVCFSQEKQKAVSKDSLGLSFTINTMTKTTCHGVEVFLKRVVVDSRCPKDVMCVRAGEAKVIVSVFKDGKHLEDKLIEVYPSRLTAAQNLIYRDDNFLLYGIDLWPYPESTSANKTNKEYELKAAVKFLN